jgi:hypothetical protein
MDVLVHEGDNEAMGKRGVLQVVYVTEWGQSVYRSLEMREFKICRDFLETFPGFLGCLFLSHFRFLY